MRETLLSLSISSLGFVVRRLVVYFAFSLHFFPPQVLSAFLMDASPRLLFFELSVLLDANTEVGVSVTMRDIACRYRLAKKWRNDRLPK